MECLGENLYIVRSSVMLDSSLVSVPHVIVSRLKMYTNPKIDKKAIKKVVKAPNTVYLMTSKPRRTIGPDLGVCSMTGETIVLAHLKGQAPLSKSMGNFLHAVSQLPDAHREQVHIIIDNSAMWDSCSIPKSIMAALLATHIRFFQKMALVFAMLSRHYGLDPWRLGRYFSVMWDVYGIAYWGGDDINRIQAAEMAVSMLNGTAAHCTVPYPDARVLEVYDLPMYKKTGQFVLTHWASAEEVIKLVASSTGRGKSEASDCVRPPLDARPERVHLTYGHGDYIPETPRGFLVELSATGPPLPEKMRKIIRSG
jgi:hypothetical protein